MSEEEKIAEVVVDFFNALEAACVNAKRQIGEVYLGKTQETVGLTWDPTKISWTQKEGLKGPFEISEDINNPEFKAMLKDLADHKGKLSRKDGDRTVFYWVFQNGTTVGRKEVRRTR